VTAAGEHHGALSRGRRGGGRGVPLRHSPNASPEAAVGASSQLEIASARPITRATLVSKVSAEMGFGT
jgi:hypothetical protein